ncbi:MAG: hypothetical protein GY807_19190, partial [Gammaproteobacteria bacterium]|nr:hypothetical protein [Gammaproteobacteria bacterium]
VNKINMYALDPVQRAIYGGGVPLDWSEIVEQKITLLVDFRHVLDTERRRWGMMWVFQCFLAYIKTRGLGRHDPLGLVIDELSQMTMYDAQSGTDMFAADLDELINVIARNYSVWCTLMHQELFQLSEKMMKTLMACGNQVFGVTADMEAALEVVQELFPYDPTQVKRYEPVYAGNPPAVIDYRPVSYTVQEYYALAAQTLKQLKTFQFLVRPAPGEGNITGKPQVMQLERDVGIWVDEERVAHIRQMLAERAGRPIDTLLAEIEARQSQSVSASTGRPQPQVKPAGQSATLAGNAPADAETDHLSTEPNSPNGELDDNAFYH